MLSSSLRLAARATASRAGARTFAAASGDHSPPISLHGLHARYANATYTAASKVGTLDAVEAELLGIKDAASKSDAFKSFLENPLIGRDDKESTVKELLGGKVSDVTLNLMTVLAGNARLSETSKIADTYVQLMKAARGEVEAKIVSADKLTKAQADGIAKAVEGQVGAGSKVVLSLEVDPTILGGLQIQIGDRFLDLSVKSQIDAVSRTVV